MFKYLILILFFVSLTISSCATSEKEDSLTDYDNISENLVDSDNTNDSNSTEPTNPEEGADNDTDIVNSASENESSENDNIGNDSDSYPNTDKDIVNDSENDDEVQDKDIVNDNDDEITDEDTITNIYEETSDDDAPVCEDNCSETAAICLPSMENEATEELCDGLDNDCDGLVDEGCSCTAGQTQPCFMGPPNFMAIGACKNGVQTCQVQIKEKFMGTWGECVGGISPSEEICDNLDNDCDGCIDDKLCCLPPINCGYDIGTADPFVDKVIDGTQIYSGGDATNWEWTLSKGPCDLILNTTSFKMNGTATTTVSGADLSQLTLNFQLSGSYTLKLKVTSPTNGELECSWIIKVISQGLRVELCWDTTGTADLDLHFGKTGTTAGWFESTDTEEDCYFNTCENNDYTYTVDWGYADVDGNNNPRLDIDNISTVGKPENINLDNPNDGDAFKVLVHFYQESIETYPVINIYCGGTLKATYGVQPQVLGFDYGGRFNAGDGWKVVDILWNGDYFSDSCELTPRFENGVYLVEEGPFSFD